MPPILPFIPAILGVADAGISIAEANKKPNTPTPTPVTTIPGSPTSIISTGGTPGASPSGGGILDQLFGGHNTLTPAANPTATISSNSGGSPPQGRGPNPISTPHGGTGGTGGTGAGVGPLPWLHQTSGAQPGTPGAT